MLDLDPTLKKKKGAAFFEIDEDLDKEWIEEHQAFLIEEQRTKISKKFEKDNEKRVADGEKEMKASELEERLQVVKEMEKKFKKENKTGKVEVEARGATVEKLEGSITKIDHRVETMSVQAQDKEDNKEVALGTSKIVSFFPVSFLQCHQLIILIRTTLILDSRLSLARSTMSPLKSSSLRRCVRSLNGPSSLLRRTGNFNSPPIPLITCLPSLSFVHITFFVYIFGFAQSALARRGYFLLFVCQMILSDLPIDLYGSLIAFAFLRKN